MNINDDVVKRLDALLGLVLTRGTDEREVSINENCRYLRNLGFSNAEIARVLGKSLHHIEVVASTLLGQGKIRKHKGE